MYIGYDDSKHHLYQGNRGTYGHPIWPNPVISQAHLLNHNVANYAKHNHISDIQTIFLEESFNPITRTKRGYLYQKDNKTQPREWIVSLHPTTSVSDLEVIRDQYAEIKKALWTFEHYRITYSHSIEEINKTRIVLGNGNAISIWKIIQIETNLAGEEFLTIKAVSNLGVLPEINMASIPQKYYKKCLECIGKVVDTAYQSGPENIVDRCRDAASLFFNVWHEIELGQPVTTDLQKTIKKLESASTNNPKIEKRIAFNCGRTIAVFHSRCKPIEQEKHNPPPINEDDGQLALHCLAAIMRELGFAL